MFGKVCSCQLNLLKYILLIYLWCNIVQTFVQLTVIRSVYDVSYSSFPVELCRHCTTPTTPVSRCLTKHTQKRTEYKQNINKQKLKTFEWVYSCPPTAELNGRKEMTKKKEKYYHYFLVMFFFCVEVQARRNCDECAVVSHQEQGRPDFAYTVHLEC